MADFNKPNLQTELTSNFEDIRSNVNANVKMLKGVDVNNANLPIDAVKFEGNTFYRWNGLSYKKELIGVSGGGTGAETAVNARINLGADNASNLTQGTVDANRLTGTYNISISGNAATSDNADNADNAAQLGGQSPSYYRNASNLNDGTVPAERLPLNNTVTSTSTTQAATANTVKTAYDKGVEGLDRASTQVGDGAVSGVYYNSLEKEADSSFSQGKFKICRIGDTVTITVVSRLSTSGSTSSISGTSVDFLPTWARPIENMITFSGHATGLIVKFEVQTNGRILFYAIGSDLSNTGRTLESWPGGNTITYNV